MGPGPRSVRWERGFILKNEEAGLRLSLSEILSVVTVTQPTDRIGVKNGADESFA